MFRFIQYWISIGYVENVINVFGSGKAGLVTIAKAHLSRPKIVRTFG